jgi:hypothetical protein
MVASTSVENGSCVPACAAVIVPARGLRQEGHADDQHDGHEYGEARGRERRLRRARQRQSVHGQESQHQTQRNAEVEPQLAQLFAVVMAAVLGLERGAEAQPRKPPRQLLGDR